MLSNDQVRKAYEYAFNEQQLWWPRYVGCYQWAMPNRNNFWQMAEGQKKDYYVFDSTAILAVRSFVAKTQASITPPGVNWCTLQAGSFYKKRQDKDEVNTLLQQLSDIMFEYLRRSNFDPVSSESYFDLAAGTAALRADETGNPESPFRFECVSQYMIACFENSHGKLTNVFRQYRYIRYDQIQKKFPYVKFPDYILERCDRTPFELCPLIDGWLDNEDGTWTNIVGNDQLSEIYYRTDEEKSLPWIVYRWAKLGGENYGRGPLLDVIGDIKTCNKMMEKFIKQADLVINPPYMALADSVINPNNIVIQPGATIPVRPSAMPGMKPLEPLMVSGNLEMGEWGFNKWWQNINQAMFSSPIGTMNDPTKTATEIQYRQQLYSEEVGPAMGRLEQEYLNPLVRRLIYILMNMGILPKEAFPDGNWTSISYQSPLIENQKMQELQSIETFTQAVDQIAGPQASMTVLDLGRTVEKLAECTNVPREIVRTKSQIDQTLQNISQQQQQAYQEAAKQGSAGGPNIPQGASTLPSQTNPGQ